MRSSSLIPQPALGSLTAPSRFRRQLLLDENPSSHKLHSGAWKSQSVHTASNATPLFSHDSPAICSFHGKACGLRQRRSPAGRIASTKERNFEPGVEEQDRGAALDILTSYESDDGGRLPEPEPSTSEPSESAGGGLFSTFVADRPQLLDDFTVLDRCERMAEFKQVGEAYGWLQSRGVLPSFGKCKVSASEGDRLVTETDLLKSVGLTGMILSAGCVAASRLSPKKWGLSGGAATALPIGLALYSFLVNSGVDVRPVAATALALGLYDSVYLGGTGLNQILSTWLPHRQRVLVHEAGHVLVAYLLGCPIRGVVLDPVHALKNGLQKQAGTQFWDRTLGTEWAQNRLSETTVDCYSAVLFAGIAAEAFIYGEAQGGETDENLFKLLVSQLQPSWSPAKISNQARWAVLQSYLLIKENKKAHVAVVHALEKGEGLGSLVRAIEEAMA